MAGCASDRCYQAGRLPVKYTAPPVENIQRVDLSRLGNMTSSSQAIDRGDVLSVTITTDYARLPAMTTPVRVGEDGCAEIPQIGRVSLAGMELENFSRAAQQMNKLVNELQEMATSVRLIPVAGVFSRMNRLVHDLARKSEKKRTL